MTARRLPVAGLVFAVGLTLVALGRPGTAAGASRPAGRTFYVARNGNNAGRGTSPRHPWRTVTRVDHARLRPGDTVLFRGGETFSDATLMPGRGHDVSGAPGRSIRFGSYGDGVATLRQGIWLGSDRRHPAGPSWLTFRDLALGPVRGFQGTGRYITLIGLRIANLLGPRAQQQTGIQTEGSHWVIADNVIRRTGDSGMLLGADAQSAGDPPGGRFYSVHGNTVTDTGRNPHLGYPAHGIYLKVANATVSDNRIIGFRDDGVSIRYRGATVTGNDIATGQIGIAWYQYDRTPGVSRFVNNRITNMRVAGIFVCGVAEGCAAPLDHFEITGNVIAVTQGVALNLQPSLGGYLLRLGG